MGLAPNEGLTLKGSLGNGRIGRPQGRRARFGDPAAAGGQAQGHGQAQHQSNKLFHK